MLNQSSDFMIDNLTNSINLLKLDDIKTGFSLKINTALDSNNERY